MQLYIWWISLGVLVLSFVAGLLSILRPYHRKRSLTMTRCLTVGVFLSGFCLLFALYFFDGSENSIFAGNVERTLLTTFQHTWRLFVLDGGYAGLMGQTVGWDASTVVRYETLGAVLFALAPLTTFGFLLTFIKNISAHLRYWISRLFFWRSVHVFSELNERSVALARSLVENRRVRLSHVVLRILFGWAVALWNGFSRPIVVFTGVTNEWEESSSALVEEARELNAILFRKDLVTVAHGRIPVRFLRFYLISEDEDAKLSHADALIRRNYRRARLYLFSDSQASRAFTRSYTQEEKSAIRMEVIRVDDIRALIYHSLDENGHLLFENASGAEGDRVISAAVVGLGRYGMEMIKGLLWYCQLPGYTVHLTVIDESPDTAERITAACPEILVGPHRDVPGDMRYSIEVLRLKAGTESFASAIAALRHPTYVFVSLGEDERNVATAFEIRRTLLPLGKTPRIETVVYGTTLRNRIHADVTVSTEMAGFDVHTIGDMESFYTEGTVIASDLVEEGLAIHSRWCSCVGVSGKNDFYMNDYNFYSSISKALHERLRKKLRLDIPGMDKPWDQRTEEEKIAIGTVEHVRWNAYMRTEGYRYSGSRDKSSRSSVAYLHNDLVPLTELTDEDLKKDA